VRQGNLTIKSKKFNHSSHYSWFPEYLSAALGHWTVITFGSSAARTSCIRCYMPPASHSIHLMWRQKQQTFLVTLSHAIWKGRGRYWLVVPNISSTSSCNSTQGRVLPRALLGHTGLGNTDLVTIWNSLAWKCPLSFNKTFIFSERKESGGSSTFRRLCNQLLGGTSMIRQPLLYSNA